MYLPPSLTQTSRPSSVLNCHAFAAFKARPKPRGELHYLQLSIHRRYILSILLLLVLLGHLEEAGVTTGASLSQSGVLGPSSARLLGYLARLPVSHTSHSSHPGAVSILHQHVLKTSLENLLLSITFLFREPKSPRQPLLFGPRTLLSSSGSLPFSKYLLLPRQDSQPSPLALRVECTK